MTSAPVPEAASASPAKQTHVRFLILFMLFMLTAINYADRSTVSIAGPLIAKRFDISTVQLGYILSAFGWSYVVCQLPGGWLLDRFGSKRVYVWAVILWSVFTFLMGVVDMLPAALVVGGIFALRLLIGAAEAPSFPGNSRITAAWFPAKERGTAAAIFNSAQYFATVLFMPLMGWITHDFGWEYMFMTMGVIGVVAALIWARILHDPKDHPHVNAAELKYLEEGGAVVNMDQQAAPMKWQYLGQLCANRTMIGIYVGQYAISCLTVFFLTWFPIYLVRALSFSVKEASFIAPIPAVAGFFGGVAGGVLSDFILRRTGSLTVGRKAVIVIGMLMSMTIIACNYLNSTSLIIFFMALAFFGKGLGALGWAVMSDSAPKEVAGVAGGLFNMFGNFASIITPIAIGYLLGNDGDLSRWSYVFWFVGGHAALAIVAFTLIAGEIKRFEIKRVD